MSTVRRILGCFMRGPVSPWVYGTCNNRAAGYLAKGFLEMNRDLALACGEIERVKLELHDAIAAKDRVIAGLKRSCKNRGLS